MSGDSDKSFSLVDLGRISKPACKLIDAISSAAGILYEPTRIRRRAKAEADAMIVLAEARGQAQDIEWRAARRLMARETRRQRNIETIVTAAVEQLPDAVSEDRVDEDWIFQFFEHCQDIGEKQMQAVWAKLLAGEVARPGRFSLRTLGVVKELREEDANLFTLFCTSVWHHDGRALPIFPLPHNACLRLLRLPTGAFLQLQSFGLILTYQLGAHGRGFTIPAAELKDLAYYGKRHSLTLPKNKRDLSLGNATLTDVGRELFPIAGSPPSEEYRQMMVDHWGRQGIGVVEHINT